MRGFLRSSALQQRRPALPLSRRPGFFILVALCLLAPQAGLCQQPDPPVEKKHRVKQPVESEIIFEGLASYGDYRIFASGSDCKLYTAGVEYDRHSWGYFLKARLDYVAEILPLVLLNEPAKQDIWGDSRTPKREIVPGLSISPIGFRMQWRSNKALKPYMEAKGGMIAFPKKVLSSEATYENFSLQSGFGLQTRLTRRVDLRLGLWSDFHFSNAFMVPINPGLDVMNSNLGISYKLGKRE